MPMYSRWVAALMPAVALLATVAAAGEHNPVLHEPRSAHADGGLDVIVKLRSDANTSTAKLGTGGDRSVALAKRTGLSLHVNREITGTLLASRVELGTGTAAQALEKLRADSQVEY